MSLEAMQAVVKKLAERIRTLESLERQEMTNGVESLFFVSLPAAGQSGRIRFVLDGRKTGEGVGVGTGVLAYDDGVNWVRVDDGTPVAI